MTEELLNSMSLTVPEFCRLERISRSALYLLWSEGRGPKYLQYGRRRLIPADARIEWRKRMIAEAMQDTAAPCA